MLKIVLVIVAIALLAFLWFWLIIVTEGVFFGRTLVVWLYDITAFRYDKVKDLTVEDESVLVVEPVLMLSRRPAPHILDVATGTGRVPYYLLNDERFDGTVVGVDLAQKMLDRAEENLGQLSAEIRPRATLHKMPADQLAFEPASFDGVTCLETLEFLPSDARALQNMVDLLKPGGFLIVTRRKEWEAYMFLWRYRSAENIKQLLADMDLIDIFVLPWQSNYDLVVARKK